MIDSSEPCPYVRAAFSQATPEQIDEVRAQTFKQKQTNSSGAGLTVVFVPLQAFRRLSLLIKDALWRMMCLSHRQVMDFSLSLGDKCYINWKVWPYCTLTNQTNKQKQSIIFIQIFIWMFNLKKSVAKAYEHKSSLSCSTAPPSLNVLILQTCTRKSKSKIFKLLCPSFIVNWECATFT